MAAMTPLTPPNNYDKKSSTESVSIAFANRSVIIETERTLICGASLSDQVEFEILENLAEEELSQEEIADLRKQKTEYYKIMPLFCEATIFRKYSIFLKDTKQYIGCFSLKNPEERENQNRMEGYPQGFSESTIYLIGKFPGKGYGTEVTKGILEKIVKPLLDTCPQICIGYDPQGKEIVRLCNVKFCGVSCFIENCNFPSLISHSKTELKPIKHVANTHFKNFIQYGFIFQFPNKKNEFTDALTKIITQWIAYGKSNPECIMEDETTEDDTLTPEGQRQYLTLVRIPYQALVSEGNKPAEKKDSAEHLASQHEKPKKDDKSKPPTPVTPAFSGGNSTPSDSAQSGTSLGDGAKEDVAHPKDRTTP